MEITLKNHKIKFFVPNKLTHYRASTILNKEPETIEWIENFEKKNNEKIIFWDIGANVGLYSIYAANFQCPLGVIWILDHLVLQPLAVHSLRQGSNLACS